MIIAYAEIDVAGDVTSLAEHKRIVARAEHHVADDLAVVHHGLLPAPTQYRNGGALDEPEIIQNRRIVRVRYAIALHDIQFHRG